jgi:hypothetical protein
MPFQKISIPWRFEFFLLNLCRGLCEGGDFFLQRIHLEISNYRTVLPVQLLPYKSV